jgi:hydrogenase nickel incorporation protein HypB
MEETGKRRRPGEIKGLQEEASSNLRVITLEQNVLEANEVIAARNRQVFKQHNVCVLNLISSPGSGKTTLLVETLLALKDDLRCGVIEGDQQTSHDAQRIAETGAPVVQINTRGGCHLEATQVHHAIQSLPMQDLDLLFIENVGNLVCPSSFDLGEHEKVAIMCVTEGEDKPVKYPLAFHLARLLVLTKVDLLPYLRFDLELCKEYARRVNPHIEILETSVFESKGLEDWLDVLRKRVEKVKGDRR